MANVAVIVPNYNHERFLKLRVDSILNQTYRDFEIILLDDGSTDNSRSVIEAYRHNPKVSKIVYNKRNTGSPFKQWVKGIMLAKANYVWIAESDDFADPEFLSSLIALTKQYPNVGIAYANSDKVDDTGKEIEDLHVYMQTAFKSGPEEVRDHLCQFNTITNVSSCLIKTEYAMKAITGLSKFRTCGDWIFYARVLQHGNLAYTSQVLNHYRWHSNSVSYSAHTTSAYTTEGVNVISYIDYNVVHFSLKEYMAMCKGWVKKMSDISYTYLFQHLGVLLVATLRFFSAKMSFRNEG